MGPDRSCRRPFKHPQSCARCAGNDVVLGLAAQLANHKLRITCARRLRPLLNAALTPTVRATMLLISPSLNLLFCDIFMALDVNLRLHIIVP